MKNDNFLLQGRVFLLFGLITLMGTACNKIEVTSGTGIGNPPGAEGITNFTAIQPSNPFNVTVGAPVDAATGNQWIANFNKTNQGLSKEYIMASQDLKNIISNTSCVGICLYFAIDEKNQSHILPIGIDASGRLIKTKIINTQNGAIDWPTAKQWIANDLGAIDARFFGRNTFSRLFKDAKCTSIRAIEALDEQGKPQLLLINAALDYKSIIGTNQAFEDRSSPCPPICGFAD